MRVLKSRRLGEPLLVSTAGNQVTARTAFYASVAVALAGALGGLLGWTLTRPEVTPHSPKRLTVSPSRKAPLWRSTTSNELLALSPDEQLLVYQAQVQGKRHLYLRPLDQLEATPIPGTEGGGDPFFSPDGEWVWVGARFSGTQDWGGSPEEVSVGKKPSTRGARAATERRRSRSRVAATTADRGRWSSKRKVEVVLRLLKGETLDAVSRGLSVSTQRLSQWRTDFLGGGQSALKTREPDQREEEVRDLRAKVGELTMDNELLYQKIERMEADLPPAPWRRKR